MRVDGQPVVIEAREVSDKEQAAMMGMVEHLRGMPFTDGISILSNLYCKVMLARGVPKEQALLLIERVYDGLTMLNPKEDRV